MGLNSWHGKTVSADLMRLIVSFIVRSAEADPRMSLWGLTAYMSEEPDPAREAI